MNDNDEKWRVLGWRREWGGLMLVVLDTGPSEYPELAESRFGWEVSGKGASLSGDNPTKQAAMDAAEDAAADLSPDAEPQKQGDS